MPCELRSTSTQFWRGLLVPSSALFAQKTFLHTRVGFSSGFSWAFHSRVSMPRNTAHNTTHTHTHTHTHTGILLTHNKEWSFAICDNIDGPWRYYVKWNKSEKDKDHTISFTWNPKTEWTNKNSYREKIGGYQRGRELGSVWNGWSGSVVWWWTAARRLVVISLYCIQMLNYIHLKVNVIYQSFSKTGQRSNNAEVRGNS